jgi:hypothetical protein
MKIMMRDGRAFQGSVLQIVRAMQDMVFGVEDVTMPKYISLLRGAISDCLQP